MLLSLVRYTFTSLFLVFNLLVWWNLEDVSYMISVGKDEINLK